MDLFAYLGRKILVQKNPSYSLFPDEKFTDISPKAKFIIYAYFPSRDSCIGIEFIEKIEQIRYSNTEQAKALFTTIWHIIRQEQLDRPACRPRIWNT